jgi:hypothetical protein
MDNFTSSTPPGHDSPHERALSDDLTRRRFLRLATGTIAIGVAAPFSSRTQAAPPPISGAEYVAMLGGPDRPASALPTMNLYPDARARWMEVASGPLPDAIDRGKLVVCLRCRFLNHPAFPCAVCAKMKVVTLQEIVALFGDHKEEEGVLKVETLEQDLTEWRQARALDLLDGPETDYACALALHAVRMMRAGDVPG